MIRAVVWGVLLVGGFVAVMVAVLMARTQTAVAVGIGGVGLLIAWGFVSTHYFGIRRRIVDRLGYGWKKGVVIKHPVRTADRQDIQYALDYLLDRDGGAGPFGMPNPSSVMDDPEAYRGQDLIVLLDSNPEPTALIWEALPTGGRHNLRCAGNALYLLEVNDQPTCVMIESRPKRGGKQAMLQILALDRAAAELTLEQLLKVAREKSIYRGRIVSIERHEQRGEDYSVQFHDLGPIEREHIVLPEEVLRIIDRNVLGLLRHAETLRKAGQGTRHGVLLHGPPGTGKTLVTRYLARAIAPATVLLLTGRQYAFLHPTIQLARALAPSLVVLEDVDLIGADRRHNRHTPVLHELMDEMDGLGTAADVLFLLTTNRPELLEPALAGRPGRVDQAVFFPLPDLECRRRLFVQFAKGLQTAGIDLEPLLRRTEGASPAFIKELFRRAALLAAERGATGTPLPLVADDLEQALRELLESGGTLTRQFLGFPAPGG